MVPLAGAWGGRCSAAPRPDETRLRAVRLGVSWPWLLVDERCYVSWSRNDGGNGALNRCVLVTGAGEGCRGWIIRETETSSISAPGSCRGAVPTCREKTHKKRCRSVYPLPLKIILHLGPSLPSLTSCWHLWAPRRWAVVWIRNELYWDDE